MPPIKKLVAATVNVACGHDCICAGLLEEGVSAAWARKAVGILRQVLGLAVEDVPHSHQ